MPRSFIDGVAGSFIDGLPEVSLTSRIGEDKKMSLLRSDSCADFLNLRTMAAFAAKEMPLEITLPLRTKLVKLSFGQCNFLPEAVNETSSASGFN